MVSKTVKKWAKHFKSKGVLGVLSPQSTDLTMQSTGRERQLWAQLASSRAWVDPIEEDLALELHEGRALERVQTRLRLQELVLNAVSQGVLISDAQGHILSANAAFLAITGYGEHRNTGSALPLSEGPTQ